MAGVLGLWRSSQYEEPKVRTENTKRAPVIKQEVPVNAEKENHQTKSQISIGDQIAAAISGKKPEMRYIDQKVPQHFVVFSQGEESAGEFAPLFKVNKSASMVFQSKKLVKKILVKPGDTVAEGQLIAYQDYADLEADLGAKEAELRSTQHALENPNKLAAAKYDIGHTADIYERTAYLFEKNAASKAELGNALRAFTQAKIMYDNLEYERKSAEILIPKLESEIASLKVRIEERKMYAPFGGEIGEVEVSEGEVIEERTVLVINDFSRIKAVCEIDANTVTYRNAVPVIFVDGKEYEGRFTSADESKPDMKASVTFEFENEQNPNGGWAITPTNIDKLILKDESSSVAQIAHHDRKKK